MAAFITGAAGFVGLAVTEALLARGERVTGFDLAPLSEYAARTFAGLPGRYDQVSGDVSDPDGLKAALRQSEASCVLHLAAVTAGAGREIADPVGIVRVNVGGAAATIEAAAACGIRRVLHLSSGSVYGASGRDADVLTEDTPLRPEQLYGITKQAGEAVALRLADLHRLDLSIGRLGTCFGRWEYATGARDTPSAPYQIVQAARSGLPAILPRVAICPHPSPSGLQSGGRLHVVDRGFLRATAASLARLRMAVRPAGRGGQHRLLRALRSFSDGDRASARRHGLPATLQP
jgi:UDP-glucuronate 4-epimerase